MLLYVPLGLPWPWMSRAPGWSGAAFGLLVSLPLEVLQATTRNRTASLLDVLANGLGHAFGYALAFFGLESWALEVAHQSYDPHVASSHLFLADRYTGRYNKNSELFQGFLTDPTAFGGSNRYATLTPRPGNYGTLGLGYTDSTEYTLSNPYVRLNGMANWGGRSAWYLDVEKGVGTVLVPTTAPDGNVVNVRGDRRAELYAVGLGMEPAYGLGLFGFGR